MMVGKEDLGLSLSLGSSNNHHPSQQLNLMPFHHPHKTHWTDILASPEGAPPPTLRGIDVNRAPAAERESDEEAGASSPNSTLSSLSGKRRPSSAVGADAISDDEDGDGSRKKLRLSKDQSAILEESFKEHSTLNPKQKVALAKQLNLRPRQVEVWFQNRRARTKLKQTEVDCEFLKRCCDNLTEENRRLQKEVAELRALKLSPQFYMHMTPPTTLTMCPSCERVNNNNINNISVAARPSLAEQHYHQRQFPVAAAAAATATSLPWAPVAMRGTYMDMHNQRS